ncbi:hypothetical protein EDB81DRAFT_875713 [Dactylonectria macrodidyma]|uniref:Uncharacterized protein n=1 Tax=Dactylonectria macrodidyma TaxID=307937 RepID=A0A9P9JP88_9HYPO|nr:hypothetical protein EDB81DRAFT_875713 [Dactylonectria macrodidyma]
MFILGLFLAVLTNCLDHVVEHRQEIETRTGTLKKRNDVCTGYLRGTSHGTLTTTCVDSYTCCYASEEDVADCIPYNCVCRDFRSTVSWCPASLESEYRFVQSDYFGNVEDCTDPYDDDYGDPTLYLTSEDTASETWPWSTSTHGMIAFEESV